MLYRIIIIVMLNFIFHAENEVYDFDLKGSEFQSTNNFFGANLIQVINKLLQKFARELMLRSGTLHINRGHVMKQVFRLVLEA